jgi:hypothetical protein
VGGDKWRELPIGSTLDKEKGVFYWSSGLEFIGEYRFVFKLKGEDKWLTKRHVIIRINPK